jgi:branched-chain amino acid aminotransferase
MSPKEMSAAINETVRANDLADCYIRVVVTRGAGSLGLDPNKCSNPQVIIIADLISLYPAELYQKGLEIITVSVMRTNPASLNPRIKSLNYLNNILAKIEGLQAGCIEALMLNHKGEIAECTGDNIFLVRKGVLYTPPIDAGILEGVTRDAVIELAQESDIEVREVPLTKHDVYIADEVFLTGTAAEVIPVVKVDSRVIGTGKPGPMTLELNKQFHALTRA